MTSVSLLLDGLWFQKISFILLGNLLLVFKSFPSPTILPLPMSCFPFLLILCLFITYLFIEIKQNELNLSVFYINYLTLGDFTNILMNL